MGLTSYILLLLLSYSVAWQTVREPTPPPITDGPSASDIEERWINVPLDHFHPTNTQQFALRYHYLFGSGSHVVILLGGPWEVSPGWLRSGGALAISRRLGGTPIFYIERRFYGKSKATIDTSTPQLRYLSTDQAMADVTHLIRYIQSYDFENGYYRDTRMIVLGTWFTGGMASWLRRTSPHLVTVALSDSGVVHAQEDLPEYLETVATLIEDTSEVCGTVLASGLETLTQLYETNEGRLTLAEMFNTCSAVLQNEDDRYTFIWAVTQSVTLPAQSGDTAELCHVMTDNTTTADPISRLASWVNGQQSSCLSVSYNELLTRLTDTSYTTQYAADRLWRYELCTQLSWTPSGASAPSMFSAAPPSGYFHKQCDDLFDGLITEAIRNDGIRRTNLFLGSRESIPDRVISSLSPGDPWSTLMVPVDLNTTMTPVITVPGTAMCPILCMNVATATEEQLSVRDLVLDQVMFWMEGLSNDGRMTSPLVMLIFTAAYIVYIY